MLRSLGQAIRATREDKAIGLGELARRVGVSVPFLHQVERGLRFPSERTLGRIEAHLGVALAELAEASRTAALLRSKAKARPEIAKDLNGAADALERGQEEGGRAGPQAVVSEGSE